MAVTTQESRSTSRVQFGPIQFSSTLHRLVLGAYWLPVLFFVFYASIALPPSTAWSILVLGVLVACFGAVSLILSLRNWEVSAEHQMRERLSAAVQAGGVGEVSQPVSFAEPDIGSEEDREKLIEAVAQLEAQQHDLRRLSEENAQLKLQMEDIEKHTSGHTEELERKDALVHEYQQTITEQRAIIEKKQHYISKLELNIQDLRYEVKTLLQLGELDDEETGEASATHPTLDVFQQSEPGYQEDVVAYDATAPSAETSVQTSYDASMQLKRFVGIAQKMTGASHLAGSESRFADLAVDSYAIDLRRLYESLRGETGCLVLLYSPKEERILFVNDQIRSWLGWAPDKFIKNFASLVQQGMAEFRHAVQHAHGEETQKARVVLKDRDGSDHFMQASVRQVLGGVFAKHLVVVLYEA